MRDTHQPNVGYNIRLIGIYHMIAGYHRRNLKKAIAINQNNMTIFLRTDTKKTSETANIKSFQIAKVLTFCKF
jgi:hypothetical protein